MSVRVLDYSLSPFAEDHLIGTAYETRSGWETFDGGSPSTWSDAADPNGGTTAWTQTGVGSRLNCYIQTGTTGFIPTGREATFEIWIYQPDFDQTINYEARATGSTTTDSTRITINAAGEIASFTATSTGPTYTQANSIRLTDEGGGWLRLQQRVADYSGTATTRFWWLIEGNSTEKTYWSPSFRYGNHIQGAPLALSVIEDAERQNLLPVDVDGFNYQVNVTSLTQSAIAAPDGTLTAWDIENTAGTSTILRHQMTLVAGYDYTMSFYVYLPSIDAAYPQFNTGFYSYASRLAQVRILPDGSIGYANFVSGAYTMTTERNVDIELVGNTGWARVSLLVPDWTNAGTSYSAQFSLVETIRNGTVLTVWNPTLRYGDWVSRGKNHLGTLTTPTTALSDTVAPDGTLSATDVTFTSSPYAGYWGTNNQTSDFPSAGHYQFSFYARPVAYATDSTGLNENLLNLRIQLYSSGTQVVNARSNLNLEDGSVSLETPAPFDVATVEQVGTTDWYKITVGRSYDGALGPVTSVSTYIAHPYLPNPTQTHIFWNPRFTIGNPADARGYFVSGPQNLLGDGSDYDPATSNWTSPYPPTLTANSEVAPNGRLEADTLEHYNSPGASYLSFTSSSVVIGSATYYNFYYKVDPTITSNIETVTYKILGPGSVLRESIVLTLNYGSATPVSVLTSTTTGGPGYTSSDVEVSEVSNDWVRISIRLFDYSADALYYQVLHYRLTTGVPFTLWGSEITTIDRASFTPPSLGEVTAFGSPISYSWAKLRLRRGTDGDRATLIGMPVAGEPIYCTDTKTLFIGDGTTRGGSPAVKPPTVVQLTTSLTTNINNATTDNLVEWDTQDVLWGDDISHDTVTNSGRITIDTDGIYEIACTVRVNATGTSASDYNGIMRCRKNGTTDFGPSSAGGYISYSLANDESSFHIPGFVYQFSAGDYFEILIDRESSQGRGVYLTANKSFLYIKRIA
jgi:hypothetical protein